MSRPISKSFRKIKRKGKCLMNLLVEKLKNTKKFQDYLIALENKSSQIQVSGLSDVGKVRVCILHKRGKQKASMYCYI